MKNFIHADYYEAESFWAGEALKDPGNTRRIQKTIELVPLQAASLLDVGCGNGAFGNMLLEARRDINVTGVDRSKSALKHVKFASQVASIDALPFEDESFDMVSCLQVIEHLPNEIYAASLAELARVARHHIIVGVPFEEDLENETTQCPQCRTVFNINFHLRSYDFTKLQNLFSDLGFKLVTHAFPAAKIRTKYVNEIASKIKGHSNKTEQFLSPVCPVCGYTEGDRTPLNLQTASVTPPAQNDKSLTKQLAKGALRAVTAVLPKEKVKGYWIVALYERI